MIAVLDQLWPIKPYWRLPFWMPIWLRNLIRSQISIEPQAYYVVKRATRR